MRFKMEDKQELILQELQDEVLVLTMNMPKRLNGWTMEMMAAIKSALTHAEKTKDVKVVIFTGIGRYYCAGVNLGATLKLGHPKILRAQIIQHNQALFDAFINFSKPLIIAINGHAIGASVTSATLCDTILAAEGVTFSTPFAALGIPPEGCSSIMFPKLMGEEIAQRILGPEGWKPTAEEGKEIGLVNQVFPPEKLLIKARELAHLWIKEARPKTYRGSFTREELLQVNEKESIALADAFLSSPFIKGQFNFLLKKRKFIPALVFGTMWLTRPLWSRLL